MSKKPESPLKNTLSLPNRWLVGVLLVLVLVMSTLQLTRDLTQVNWGNVFAEFPGIAKENEIAANRDKVDPPAKTTFIDDNYHRCQNKVGIEMFWVQGGGMTHNGSPISRGELDQLMKDTFVAGAKYFTVHMYSYTDQDRDNLIEIVKTSINRQLTPILLPEVTGSNDADTLVRLYTAIAEAVPNSQFVGGSVPEDYTEERGDYPAAIAVSTQVAERLKDVQNVAVGTPVISAEDDPARDRIELMYKAGLKLEYFDFLLVKIRNGDLKFDGTWDPRYKYQSDYSQTAYYRFSEILEKNADQSIKHVRVRGKQWLRDNNNQDFRQHMQAIVVDFGLQVSTFTTPGGKMLPLTFQRLEDDFARFGADPDVRAVIFSAPPNVPYSIDTKEISRFNFVSTNCSYTNEDSTFRYPTAATSPVCSVEDANIDVGNTAEDFTEGRVVCDYLAYYCMGEIIYTAQIGLPIRHFGSNSPAGTDTNPYSPIATTVANNNYLTYLNPYNQYSQTAETNLSTGYAYIFPWLGSALYNSSELLRTQFYAAKDLRLLTTLPINDFANSAEYFAKLSSGYYFDSRSTDDYRTKTLWCYNGIRTGDGKPGSKALTSVDPSQSKVLTPDEFALYFGKGFCVAKDMYTEMADSFQSFDIDKQSNEYKDAPVCGNTSVKTDPQNMVYGAELIVHKDKYSGTGDDLCYDGWRGDRDLTGGTALNCSLYSSPSQNRKPDGSTPPAGLICDCQENLPEVMAKCNPLTDPYQCARRPYTPDGIKTKSCSLNLDQVKFCLDYNAGADSLMSTTVRLHKTNFPGTNGNPVPQTDIPGIYSSMATVYKHVQDQLGQRGLKLIFKEDWGWQSDIILRAYMNAAHPLSQLPRPRESLMFNSPTRFYSSLADALGAPTNQLGAEDPPPDTGTGGGAGATSASCRIGVNLAKPADQVSGGEIAEAAEIGYGLGQVIIYGPGDAGNAGAISAMNQMCQQGVVPVIRSCTMGNCGFSNGTEQANTYNALTAAASACQEIYVTCGHNEPISEFAPGMVAEGAWTRDCVRGITGGNVKISASIFNATYDDGITDVIDHATSFISGYGSGNFNADKSKIACIGLNTYDVVSGSINDYERAEFYYNKTMTAVPEFAGMKGCVMETGSLNSTASGDMVDLVGRLGAIPTLEFMLGFNWMGSNPGWPQFAIDDKGRAAVNSGCAGGSGAAGTYMKKWIGYMADGKSYDVHHQYYEMIGLLDELIKINDVLARSDLLSTGTIVQNQSGGTARYQEFVAELFSGWYGCGSAAHKAFGEKANCIGLRGDSDPLGEFLCSKGFVVDEKCQMQCVNKTPSKIDLDKPKNAACPLRDDSCFQGPMGSMTHYCAGADPAFDLYNTDETVIVPEDGTVIYAEGHEAYKCSAIIGASKWNKDTIKDTNKGRQNGNEVEILKKIDELADISVLESSGGVIGFMGDSGVYYRLRHVNIDNNDVGSLVGKRFVGGQPFTVNSVDVKLYHIQDNIYTPCWRGAHLHTWAKTGVNASSDPGGVSTGQYINGYDLYTDVLGCKSTTSAICGKKNDNKCAPPDWVNLNGSTTGNNPDGGGITGLSCKPQGGNTPATGCNEWNCGIGKNDNFQASLSCITNLGYLKTLSTALWVDRYGPYCDNETLGLPFASNLFKFYDTYLAPGTPGGRQGVNCNAQIPTGPRPQDKGMACPSYTSPIRQPGDPTFDYYRKALTDCPIPQAQMGWTQQNSKGMSPEQLADYMIQNVTYSGMKLSNTPREKIIEVLRQAQAQNVNPFVIVGIWGTESWFGQYKPECNVY